jgi:hypothetical protein
MQIVHTDQKNKKAVVSLFFEEDDGGADSDFLKRLGFDPELGMQTLNEALAKPDSTFFLER